MNTNVEKWPVSELIKAREIPLLLEVNTTSVLTLRRTLKEHGPDQEMLSLSAL